MHGISLDPARYAAAREAAIEDIRLHPELDHDQEVWQRADDVTTIYNETLVPLILPLLEEYRVRYLVVGPLERAYYDPVGLQKFPSMVEAGLLQVVFQNEGVTIYLVVD